MKKTKFSCQACGKIYGREFEANKCRRTKKCIERNFPDLPRKMAYQQNILMFTLLFFVVGPIGKQDEDKAVAEIGKNVLKDVDALVSRLNIFNVNINFILKKQIDFFDFLEKIWPSESKPIDGNVVRDNETYMHQISLCIRLIEEVKKRTAEFLTKFKIENVWDEVLANLQSLYEALGHGRDYDFDTKVFDSICDYVFYLPLKLFLVNDRFWVAASDEAQAAEIVKTEYSIVEPKIEQIRLTEILEGNIMANDLLMLAKGKPCIVGRAE